MSPRNYRSIGDVLTLLRAEFPDITISKIRFLESQGLVSPQRSPSGYRKFYDEDIERLRYVLVQQREHFLPLKVIRDRLNGEEGVEVEGNVEVEETVEVDVTFVEEIAANGSSISMETFSERVTAAAASHPHTNPPQRRGMNAVASDPSISDVVSAMQEGPTQSKNPSVPKHAPASAVEIEADAEPDDVVQGETVTTDELASAIGQDANFVDALLGFGIIHSVTVGGMTCFDENNTEIARIAAGFAGFGIEPRHLRAFKFSVDREIGLIDQIVSPLLRQRNPKARATAKANAKALARLGREMRATLILQQLKDLFAN